MGWLERLKLPPVPALGRLSPDKVGREAEDYLRRIKDALGSFSLEGLVLGAEDSSITFPATPHALLSSTHTDTSPATPGAGSLLKGDGALWEEFAIGAADRVLFSNASDVSWAQVPTGAIADAAVTYAKIQDVSAASRLLGRGSSAGSGDAQELTLGGGLSMSGTVLSSSTPVPVVLRPAQVTSNQNDYSPGTYGALSTVIFINTNASRNFSGILATGAADGLELLWINNGTQDEVLQHENAGSAAANRLICAGAGDLTILATEMARIVRDGTAARWRVFLL